MSFPLEHLATAGLFAFARPIEQLLTKRGPLSWPFLRWAVEPLTATLAASLLSLPILLYHFGRLSLIAPLANIVMVRSVLKRTQCAPWYDGWLEHHASYGRSALLFGRLALAQRGSLNYLHTISE